ncbi:MAG: hypothetical protein ABSD48_17965 [Armatimonadota bacterium]
MSHSANVGRRCSGQVRSLVLWPFLLIGFGVLMTASGCGRRAPKSPAVPAAAPIAAWAPKNPSPAFLRAAKVLKPLPEEVQQSSELLPALFELFGTLTDDQLKTFLQRKQDRIPLKGTGEDTRTLFEEKYGAKEAGEELVYDMHEVSVPYKSLTPAQREAFEKVKAAWPSAFMGREQNEDLLVHLYKMGAKEDLSNVAVGFYAAGHQVSFELDVKKQNGSNAMVTAFAQL